MQEQDQQVAIMGAEEVSSLMDHVINPQTGAYLYPVLSAEQQERIYRALQIVTLGTYQEQHGGSQDGFTEYWQAEWQHTLAQRGKEDPNQDPVFILDSGFLPEHPLLSGCILRQHDVTGEAHPEDEYGHGTMVALIYRMTVFYKPRFVNVKVIHRNGRGAYQDLLAGMQYAIDQQKSYHYRRPMLNISAGIYNTWPCFGTCPLCRKLIEVANYGFLVTAAAGNRHGQTSCPARAALHNKDQSLFLFAVGTEGERTSGKGNINGLGGTMFMTMEAIQRESGPQ